MRRRDLLAGTTGAVCGLAGCTGSTFGRLQSERPDTDGDESVADSSDDADPNSADAIEVGDPDEVPFPAAHPPHEFELRNEGETDRTVSVTISVDGDSDDETEDRDDGTGVLLERDLDLAAGDGLTFVLVEPRSYTITVTTSSDEGTSESTVIDGVDRAPFDCTRSRTTLTVSDTDTQTESASTSISCPVPTVADASLEVGERACADETADESAVVEFASESVIVSGEIMTPTPCHDLSLAETDYDERSDILAITVAVGEQAGDTCTDCLGTADYEARIDLEGRYPGRVEVYHEARDETQRITAAEY